jgi:hypothetical protein
MATFGAARKRYLFDKDFELLKRAIAGARRLSNEKDDVIATAFDDILLDNVEYPSSGKSMSWLSWLPPAVSIAFADKLLEWHSIAMIDRSTAVSYGITVTAHDPLGEAESIKHLRAAKLAIQQISKSTDTFAQSMSSSSDLSSMRRIARQRASVLSSISWHSVSMVDELPDRSSIVILADSTHDAEIGQIAVQHDSA